MNTQYIHRKELSHFSSFSSAFSEDQAPFSKFIQAPFSSPEDLVRQAKLKQQAYGSDARDTLVRVLGQQTAGYLSDSQEANLEALRSDKTFTITTGHQLTLFGGPMFMLYKVFHVVKLAEEFNKKQQEFKAVPVFWMASEDHDIDEIRSASVFNKTVTWDTTAAGAAGRLDTKSMAPVLEELTAFFASNEHAEMKALLSSVPLSDYGSWYQEFISRLFADYGVLVIQPDSPELKQLFVPVLHREIAERVSLPAVELSNKELEAAGLKPQAQARACNLFYLDDTGRHRIDPSASGYTIDGEVYSTEKLLEMADRHPDRFSPNVILRPVYQETVLPNLAYIGGGGEMAYWIQLKGVFAAQDTLFPLLHQRNSLMLIDGGTQKRMAKIGWDTGRFLKAKEQLRSEFLRENDEESLDMSELQQEFNRLREKMVAKARSVDVTLESFAEAESVRMEKQLESFGQRLVKQVKQQHEQSLKNIDAVSDRLFPGGTLQERYFHWLQFAPGGDYSGLLREVYEAIDPFRGDLIVLHLKN